MKSDSDAYALSNFSERYTEQGQAQREMLGLTLVLRA
jgi:hypothetical protein